MRRPILLILYVQTALILLLYYLNPFGLSCLLDKNSSFVMQDGQIAGAEGIVKKIQIKESYTAITLMCGNENLLVRLSGFTDGSDPQKDAALYDLVGRKISVTGEISLPSSVRNPGDFNYRRYLKGQGIYAIMDVSVFRLKFGRVVLPFSHLLSMQKGIFYEKIRAGMDDESFSMLAGILFGDKSYMDDDLYESFQTNGIAHILAVSGLHVNLVYSVIEKFLKGRKNKYASVLTALILYAYTSLSNFSVSVLRAASMIMLKLLAGRMQRPCDTVCSASLCASIFLLFNPYLLFDSGFQLSFTAAFIMGTALPYVTTKIRKYANLKKSDTIFRVGNAVAAPAVIQFGMLPLTVYHFLNISVISFFINPVAIALAGIILPAGLASFALSFIFPEFITAVSSGPATFFIKILNTGNNIALNTKLSFSCPSPPAAVIIFFYILFFWYFSETRIMLNRIKKHGVTAVICALLMFFWAIIPKSSNLPDVCFIDVGQGDSCLINVDGYHILIDGGGSYFKNTGRKTLKPFLLRNGISSIDLAIVSHKDRDHSKGIYELNECFYIKEIIDDDRENENCLVCKAYVNGSEYLFMGDADTTLEKKLLKLYPDLSCDVIKIGHHGSKTSSSLEFISAVKPLFAVISCGKNNSYGHPAASVIELLENSGIIYARTDISGAICITTEADTLSVTNAAKDTTWHTADKQ